MYMIVLLSRAQFYDYNYLPGALVFITSFVLNEALKIELCNFVSLKLWSEGYGILPWAQKQQTN